MATISMPNLQGRAYFTVKAQPAHLLIEPVAASDEGDYRCRVDFRKARTVNTIISLKVITPPQVPRITDSNGNQLSGLVGPYNEGDELTLTCLTKGGKPRPSLIWWRDYAIIDDSFEFNDRDVKPTEVRITQLTPILVAGIDALFECNTYGSRPMPTIYWLFDGKRWDTRIHGEQQTTSTITIRLERRHRGMTIECVVENIRIPGSAIRDQTTLDVQYPPQLELKLGAPSLSLDTIQEGIDIYFDCHVDSNPSPTTPITWLFNGETLLPEAGVIESNQSLVLQRVQRWRNGTYQCKCANQQGTMISNTIVLEIKFAPVCRTPYTLIYGLNINELVQIGCEVDARPAQVSFSWRFEKQNNLPNFIQVNDSKSVLEYIPRNRQQYGLVECVAKNDIGIQREPCRYFIVPAAGPFFPYDCIVSNQSDSTLSIRCDGSIVMNTTTTVTKTGTSTQSDQLKQKTDGSARYSDHDEEYDKEDDEEDEEEDSSILTGSRIKYHGNNNGRHNGIREKAEKFSGYQQMLLESANLTTSDIYALYFAPDTINGSPSAELGETIGMNGGQQQQRTPPHNRLTYRNGGGQLMTQSNKLSPVQLEASAQLLLDDLVGKFNAHNMLNQVPHLFAYPPTYYICEIYALTPRNTLIKNVTIDAVGRRIMNPFNGSFSFMIDQLPANTPLRLNIYAQNSKKRSPVFVELDARTQRAAERRIDFAQQGGEDVGHARGRKSSFFEELYGGYGRFRSKHLVVGLLIGAVAVAVFVAILLIIIATVRSKGNQHQQSIQSQDTRLTILGNDNKCKDGRGSLKRRHSNNRQSFSRSSTQLNLTEELKETTFGTGSNQEKTTITTSVDMVSTVPINAVYGEYGPYTLEGDDDCSMRSDHQLIQASQSNATGTTNVGHNIETKYYQTLLKSQRAPPSYFELEQSILTDKTNNIGGGGAAGGHAFVNLIDTNGEAKPDLIQTATIYSNQSNNDIKDGTIFDTISFESPGGVPIDHHHSHHHHRTRTYDLNQISNMIARPRYVNGHQSLLQNSADGSSGSASSNSTGADCTTMFATLPRGGHGSATQTTNLDGHRTESGNNVHNLIETNGDNSTSYIYIQHLSSNVPNTIQIGNGNNPTIS
ncbi:hypothetical protein BLOT_010907, partial [Blomia tropicalis]